jgi:hypothetical protein
MIGLGDTQNTMTVTWRDGLGWHSEPAEIRAHTITVVGSDLPAVIQIRGPKTATLIMSGGQIILHMRGTKEPTTFNCE